jgi:uncharacterized membrane protein YqaE (UPF0057 family)
VFPEKILSSLKVCPYELHIIRLAFLRLPFVFIVVDEVKGLGKIENVCLTILSFIPEMLCPV